MFVVMDARVMWWMEEELCFAEFVGAALTQRHRSPTAGPDVSFLVFIRPEVRHGLITNRAGDHHSTYIITLQFFNNVAAMSKYPVASSSAIPTILPPQHAESKRDRKRRETVNKIELLHNGSWLNRDE